MALGETIDSVKEGIENFTLVGVSFVMPQIPLSIAFGAFSDVLTILIQVLTMLYLFLKIVSRGNNSSDRDKSNPA